MPSPAEYAEQERHDRRMAERKELAELRAENERLRETIAEWQEIHGTFTGDVHAACQAEIERLRSALHEVIAAGHDVYCKASVGRCNCPYSVAAEALVP